MNKKRIYTILDSSFLDFPQETPLSVFFSGCNFRCQYCMNSDVVVGKPGMSLNEVLDYLKNFKDFYSGVCMLGGEPLLQPLDVLKQFCSNLKRLGLKVKIDTNGSFFYKLKTLVEEEFVDMVAMDVKHKLDLSSYQKVTSLTQDEFDNVVLSLNFLLSQSKIPYILRTTVCSPVHTVEDIQWLLKRFPGLQIQRYSRDGNQSFRLQDLSALKDARIDG